MSDDFDRKVHEFLRCTLHWPPAPACSNCTAVVSESLDIAARDYLARRDVGVPLEVAALAAFAELSPEVLTGYFFRRSEQLAKENPFVIERWTPPHWTTDCPVRRFKSPMAARTWFIEQGADPDAEHMKSGKDAPPAGKSWRVENANAIKYDDAQPEDWRDIPQLVGRIDPLYERGRRYEISGKSSTTEPGYHVSLRLPNARPLFYSLVDRKPVAVDSLLSRLDEPKTLEDFEARWRVGRFIDEARKVEVSTTFLAVDHARKGPPILFESMILGDGAGELRGTLRRYSTWEDAEKGHAELVEAVKRKVDGR